MGDVHQRKFGIVLVWKIDRFGRSLKHLVNALADLEAYGVAFVSLKNNLDLSTPSGRLMFQIIGAMAEFERALIQERVRSGMAQARRAGKRIGRPALRHFSPAELERIRALRTQGTSVRKLAKDFSTTQWMIAKLVTPSNATEGATA